MASSTKLGRVSQVPKGPFVLGTQYQRLDLVMDEGGNTYMAKEDSVNVPLSNETKWMKIVDVDAARILKSPNGTLYRLRVANDGTLSTEAIQ